MSAIVTLHVYSGRPNPSWELSSQQIQQLVSQLRSLRHRTLMKPPGIVGRLGYSGFSITAVREAHLDPLSYVESGIVDLSRAAWNLAENQPQLEHWLLSTAGHKLNPVLKQYVEGVLTAPGTTRGVERLKEVAPKAIVFDVPPWDPGKWNNDPNVCLNNNCYNYANDMILTHFGQPGNGSGSQYTDYSCGNVGDAAVRDHLSVVPTTPASTPAVGHYVALVMWPGQDYHWYRLDSNGFWSQKHGQAPATNADELGVTPIVDPATCNRGSYTDFCGYFLSDPAVVTIN